MCQINFSINASDSDGNILNGEGRYRLVGNPTWNTFNISDITTAQTPNITIQGDYDLEVRVQDNDNAYSIWSPVVGGFKIGNCTPTANANIDQTIQLPTNTVTLNGSGNLAYNSITSYLWEKVSGGTAVINNLNSANTTVTGLVEGNYVMRLTVTYSDNTTATDEMTITVNPAINVTPTISSVTFTSGNCCEPI